MTEKLSDTLRAEINEATSEGITLYQIAKGCDLDWRIVNGFANGTSPNIRISSVDALADYFGLELAPRRRRKKAQTATKQSHKKARKKK